MACLPSANAASQTDELTEAASAPATRSEISLLCERLPLHAARTPPDQKLVPIDRPVVVGVDRIEATTPQGGRQFCTQAVEKPRVLREIDALIAVHVELGELLFGIGQLVGRQGATPRCGLIV